MECRKLQTHLNFNSLKTSNLQMACMYLGRGAWGGGSLVAMLPSYISSSQSAYSTPQSCRSRWAKSPNLFHNHWYRHCHWKYTTSQLRLGCSLWINTTQQSQFLHITIYKSYCASLKGPLWQLQRKCWDQAHNAYSSCPTWIQRLAGFCESLFVPVQKALTVEQQARCQKRIYGVRPPPVQRPPPLCRIHFSTKIVWIFLKNVFDTLPYFIWRIVGTCSISYESSTGLHFWWGTGAVQKSHKLRPASVRAANRL